MNARSHRSLGVLSVVLASAVVACTGSASDASDVGAADAATTETPKPGPAPSSSAPRAPVAPASQKVLDEFWATFLAGDIDALPAVQTKLTAARGADPKEPALALVLGMSFVWSNAENERAKTPLSLQEMQAAAQATLVNLQDLTKLAPNEPRAWAHLGTAMVTIGGATGNATMRDQGRAMVEAKTMPAEKAEGSFALAAAMSQAPLGSPGFDQSIEYFFAALEDCLGRALDRNAPDFVGYDDKRTTTRPRDVCFNQPHWPHAEEGNFLVFGDALVKANKLEAARRAYAAALKVPEATTWKYRDVVTARLSENLQMRMMRYRVPGATAPSVGASPANCGQCHTK
jgi:hypothetical protein